MIKDSISTEGRIFAQRIMREVKASERQGASIISKVLRVPEKTSWEQALMCLHRRITAPNPLVLKSAVAPSKQAKLIAAANIQIGKAHIALLIKLATELRCMDEAICRVELAASQDHSGVFGLQALHTGDHTFIGLEGEEQAIVAHRTVLVIAEGKIDGMINIAATNVSEHVLGCLHDRLPTDAPELRIGFDFIRMCSTLGQYLPMDRRLVQSGINAFFGDGLVATGAMKMGGIGHGMSAPFFDCRTVLTRDMCTDEQLEQANAIAVFQDCYARDDVNGAKRAVAAVQYLARRSDYISQTIEAKSRKPH